jgi:hypothetical protein
LNYIELLNLQGKEKQIQIEGILKKYKVQPVGTGYIDLITLNYYTDDLIKDLTAINILVEGVTWWCHCTEEIKSKFGCPHGFGGPKSRFFEGIFFEAHIQMFEVSKKEIENIKLENLNSEISIINNNVLNYINHEFKNDEEFLECLIPGLWLSVPRDWNRIDYYTKNSFTSD